MSVFAIGLLLAQPLAIDVDRDTLRQQAAMPGYSFQWQIASGTGPDVLTKSELRQLRAVKHPTAHQQFRIADLEFGLSEDKAAKARYAKVIPLLKKQAGKSAEAQSELALAYARSGHAETGLAIARKMTQNRPDSWLSWATLGAVRTASIRYLEGDQTNALNVLSGGDPSHISPAVRKWAIGAKAVGAEAKAAFDKAVALAPLEPRVYPYRSDYGITGAWVLLVAGLFDAPDHEAAVKMFVDTATVATDDARRVALLTGGLRDRLVAVQAEVMTSLIQRGMEGEGETPDVKESIPEPRRDAIREMLDKAMAQANGLSRADRGQLLKAYGPVYYFLDRPDKAILLTAQSARDLSNDEGAALNHIDILMVVENFTAAEAAGQGYLQAHPDWSKVRFHTAKAMESAKHYSAGLTLMAEHLKKHPKDVPALLAAASFRLRMPDYQKGLESIAGTVKLLDALKLEDKSMRNEAAVLRGICLGLTGKVDEAKAVLEAIDDEDDSALQERVSAALSALS